MRINGNLIQHFTQNVVNNLIITQLFQLFFAEIKILYVASMYMKALYGNLFAISEKLRDGVNVTVALPTRE